MSVTVLQHRRFRITFAVFTAIVVAASLIWAYAVNIGLQNSTVQGAYGEACTDAVTPVAATLDSNNHPIISNIATSCYGLPIELVVVHNNNISDTFSAPSGASSSSITLSPAVSPNNDISFVSVFFNGFNIPVVWNFQPDTGPLVPGGSGYELVVVWSQPAATQFCADVTVTSTSTTPISWTAVLDVTQPPANGDTNISHYTLSNRYKFSPNAVVNGTLTIIGSNPSTNTVSAGKDRHFTICNYNAGDPEIDPNATYTVTVGASTGPSYYVCKPVTVEVTGTPWRVGWEAEINITDIRADYLGIGGQASIQNGGYSILSSTADTITVAGTGWDTKSVSTIDPRNFNVCWGA